MGVFRLLLALSVIADHTSHILGTELYPGNVAVQIFFMISGFYMAMVLDGRYTLDRKGLKLFYTNRALRLYPAYLAVALIIWAQFFVVWAILRHPPMTNWIIPYETMPWTTKILSILTNWLLIGTDIFSNMFYSSEQGAVFMFPSDPPLMTEAGMTWMQTYRTIGPAWSIGTEIWFYLLAPFLVRIRWPFLVAIAAASLACRLWIADGLGRYPYFFFPAQLLFFIAGICCYRIYRRWIEPSGRQPWQRWIVWANWALVIVYPWCASWLPGPVHYLVIGLSLPCLFASTKHSRWDRFVGDLSYPVYLVHLFMWSNLTHFHLDEGWMVALASIAMALAILMLVEKPFERVRRRRVSEQVASPAMIAASS